MDRIARGRVCYKKNIRREHPHNRASFCNRLSRSSMNHCILIEQWHDPSDSMDTDIDVEIDSDTAEKLFCLSQPIEYSTSNTSLDSITNDMTFTDTSMDIEDSSSLLCSKLNKSSMDHCIMIEKCHDPSDSMDTDIDVEIDSDTAEELSCLSQPIEYSTSNTSIDSMDIGDSIAHYMRYTSEIPTHHVNAVFDLVNYYDKQRQRTCRPSNKADEDESADQHISGTKRPHSHSEDNELGNTTRN